MYPSYEREKSRQRSRDREKKSHGRSPSEDSNDYRKNKHRQFRQSKSRGKRVKFEENSMDVKVFRKEDEPSAKGLNEQQILKLKTELEKEISQKYDFNWEHFKHRDALSESTNMREQREKERALTEKLMSAKELIGYSCPVAVRRGESVVQLGVDSSQRQGHTARIHDILGCYYTHLSEIPNQPQFQILNTNNSNDSKVIKFQHDSFLNDSSYSTNTKKNNDQKPLKGILKMPLLAPEKPPLEPRNINPQLILLLKDLKLNPTIYSKDKTEQLLKPYRESGELEYLTKNKDVLEMMLRTTAATQPAPKPSYNPSSSTGRESFERTSQPQNYPQMGGYSHSFVPKADKYRTVPCKYYHSHLGCNKTDNCTYIHDERYKGITVPPNYSPPTQQKLPNNYQPPTMYKSYPNNSMPGMMPSMTNSMMPPPNYSMGPPMTYPNPGYYPPNSSGQYPAASGNYSGGGNSNSYSSSNNVGPYSAGNNSGGYSGDRNGRGYAGNPGSYSSGGNSSGYPGYPPPYMGPYSGYGNPSYPYYSQGNQNNQKN